MFQYKVIHNILPYGNRSYTMKILNSRLCNYCSSLETLPHMLVECHTVHDFCVKVVTPTLTLTLTLTLVLSILYGYYPAEIFCQVQKLELKTLSLSPFLDFVKNKIIVQRAISQSTGQMNKFYFILYGDPSFLC